MMAGRFLSLEEAARQLGVSVDEVNRLVDRKKLFPMRDGAAVKFKADDVERVARDMGDDASQADDLALDLDMPAAAPDDELAIGDLLDGTESIFAPDPPRAPGASQTIVRGGGGPPAASGLTGNGAAGSVTGGLDDDDLALESIIGASSPGLGRGGSVIGSDLAIGGVLPDKAAGGPGSIAGLSSPSGTGAALSGALDTGLSLEDADVQLSGIDIGGSAIVNASSASIVAEGSFLGGDEFQLGSDTADDESASVVIATEETGDSSFFGAAIGGEGSVLSDEAVSDSASVLLGGEVGEYALETPFSPLQIAGLVCCSLLLLFGGFVLYDVVRTIGSPDGPSLASPLVNAMAETFGWR
jgi:excisionase family DNA binding protein